MRPAPLDELLAVKQHGVRERIRPSHPRRNDDSHAEATAHCCEGTTAGPAMVDLFRPGGCPVTVCIAALFGNREGAVLVSDRMVTANFPIGYEFEHQDISKIVPMDDNRTPLYALAAGDVLVGTEILDLARAKIREQQRDVTALEASEIVRGAYQFVRLQHIVQRELEPRGLDLENYYGRHQMLSPQVLQMVDQAMSQANAGVEFIIVGPGAGGFTLHTVVNPGVTNHHTPIGYSAIGSGAPHALYYLIEASYEGSKDRDTVNTLVNNAKTRSEVAPGVGAQTQSLVICGKELENETT